MLRPDDKIQYSVTWHIYGEGNRVDRNPNTNTINTPNWQTAAKDAHI